MSRSPVEMQVRRVRRGVLELQLASLQRQVADLRARLPRWEVPSLTEECPVCGRCWAPEQDVCACGRWLPSFCRLLGVAP